MYHVSAQGVDERTINVHYYYYYEMVMPREGSETVLLLGGACSSLGLCRVKMCSLSLVWQHEKCWYCRLWSLPPFPSFGFWSRHLTVSESHVCPVDILLSTLTV